MARENKVKIKLPFNFEVKLKLISALGSSAEISTLVTAQLQIFVQTLTQRVKLQARQQTPVLKWTPIVYCPK